MCPTQASTLAACPATFDSAACATTVTFAPTQGLRATRAAFDHTAPAASVSNALSFALHFGVAPGDCTFAFGLLARHHQLLLSVLELLGLGLLGLCLLALVLWGFHVFEERNQFTGVNFIEQRDLVGHGWKWGIGVEQCEGLDPAVRWIKHWLSQSLEVV